MEVDFNDFLDENFDEIIDAIDNKGKILKELFAKYKNNPGLTDQIIKIIREARDESHSVELIRENLSVSKRAALHIMNMPLSDITLLSADTLKNMLDYYNKQIEKLKG